MLSNQKIEEFKKNKRSNCQINFLIKKSDKGKLDSIADKKNIYTSELLRLLITEFINEQEKIGVI
ncbi:hypothetical protein LCGC14_0524680 [marine sediment metagenome]|uniref:Uncharacterized protein n=1 Tax=marine sediment metagenome TaxID=412755 RepID=A0A0F9V5K4_9ZZZZ